MNYAKTILAALIIFTAQSSSAALTHVDDMRSEISAIPAKVQRFRQALADGDTELIKSFFTQEVDINKLNHFSPNPPLIQAVFSNNCKSVAYILSLGADVNAQDIFKETALMKAIDYNFIEIGLLLLQQQNIAINAQNDRGNTALHMALFKSPIFVERLLVLGADIELANAQGDLPAFYGHVEMVLLRRLRNVSNCFFGMELM